MRNTRLLILLPVVRETLCAMKDERIKCLIYSGLHLLQISRGTTVDPPRNYCGSAADLPYIFVVEVSYNRSAADEPQTYAVDLLGFYRDTIVGLTSMFCTYRGSWNLTHRIGLRGGVDPEGILDRENDDGHKLHNLEGGWATRLVGTHGGHGHQNSLSTPQPPPKKEEEKTPPENVSRDDGNFHVVLYGRNSGFAERLTLKC